MTKSPEKEYLTPRKGERRHFCALPWNSLPPLFFAHIFPFPRDHLGDKGGRKREEEGVKLSWVVFPFPPLLLPPPPAREKTDVTSFKKLGFSGVGVSLPTFPSSSVSHPPLLHIERVRPLNYEITHAELRRRRDRPAQGDGRTGGRGAEGRTQGLGGNLRES